MPTSPMGPAHPGHHIRCKKARRSGLFRVLSSASLHSKALVHSIIVEAPPLRPLMHAQAPIPFLFQTSYSHNATKPLVNPSSTRIHEWLEVVVLQARCLAATLTLLEPNDLKVLQNFE
jgi:hypothetical protein